MTNTGGRKILVRTRERAAHVLRHAGYSDQDIDGVLAGILFPVTLSSLEHHAERFGITRGSLTDRLGGSP